MSAIALQHIPLIVDALDRLDTIVLVLAPPDAPEALPTILAASGAFTRRTVTNPQSDIQPGFAALVLPATSRTTLAAIGRAAADATTLSGEILLRGRRDPFWLGFSLTTIPAPGASACCVLIGKDITDQMRRSGEDRATQRLFASAFMSVNAAAAIITGGDRIVTASRCFAMQFGRSSRELTGSSLASLLDTEARQRLNAAMATGTPGAPATEFHACAIQQDGLRFPAAFSVAMIEGRATERLGVLTLQPDAIPPRTTAEPAPPDATAAPDEVAGKIRLVELCEVKAALGLTWPRVADRALKLAETVIRRNIGDQDIFSRTPDQAFLVWFQRGTAEENEQRAARVAREVRIVLLTEFADAITSSIASATAPPPGSTPGRLSATTVAEANKQPKLASNPTIEAARAYLGWAKKELPAEAEPMFGRGGQPLPAVWCSLPETMAASLEQCVAALPRETLGALEIDVVGLRAGISVAAKAAANNLPRSCFVPLPCAVLLAPRPRAIVMEALDGIDNATGSRLTVLLAGPFTDIGAARLRDLAAPLRSRVRAVGLATDAIGGLPLDAVRPPFSVASFQPDSLDDERAQAAMRQAITAIQRAGVKVIARKVRTPADARKLLELGVDYICGTAPSPGLGRKT